MATNETVTLTAELRDEMSAPLSNAIRGVDNFTDAVVGGAKKQKDAVKKSTAQIGGDLGKTNRLFGGMTSAVSRATGGASRLFAGFRGAVQRSLAGLPEYSQRQGERTGSAFGRGLNGTLKTAVGIAAAYMGAQVFGGFIKDAAAASDATDKFKATMSFAGLDNSAITAASKAAKSYADQTVYDLPTIQNMIAQLASNGVKDYTGLTKAAGNLNAVAGGNAETFKSVAMTMTQTAGAGKLTTENWNQLSDAIPGAAGPLMKAMKDAGAYTGNFRDAMEKGMITSDEFNDALLKLGTKPVAVQAAKSTATFEGALGNLQATINSGLMKALDKIKPGATKAITALANGLGPALDKVIDGAQGLYDLIVKGDFTGAFRDAFNVEEDSPMVDVLFNIRDAAMKLPEAAQKLWDMRGPIGVIAGLIMLTLIPYWGQLATVALESAAKQRLAWLMVQGAAFKAGWANVFAFTTMVAGWVLAGAQALIQGARIAAGWLLAMGPIGWAIGIVALLVGAFVWAYNNIGWFKDGVDAAMKWVGDAIKAAADWAVGAWNNAVNWWNTTLMPAIQAVGKWFADAWGGIVGWWNTVLLPAIGAVGQWFSDLFTNIGNWARDFVGFFIDGWGMLVDFYNNTLYPGVIKPIADGFAFLFDWVRRLVWNFATIVAFLWLKMVDLWNGVLQPALAAVGKWFSDIFTWIWTYAVKPVVDFIVGAFNNLVSFWNTVLLPAIQAVATWFTNAFQTVLNWWNTVFIPALQALGQWFADIFAWIYNNVIVPYVNFWISVFQNIVNWWNGTFLPALQAVGQWFSDVFNWIYNNIIKPIVDLIVGAFNGLVDFWNGVLLPAAQAVGTWFTDTIGGAINGIKGFIDDLITGFNGFISFWQQTLKPVVDTIASIFNGIGDAIGYALGKLGEFANNPLGGIQDLLGIQKDGNGQGKMPGASGGGVFGKFAGGGVLGGYAPGRDSILARLSPGESVLVPELTRAIGPQNIMAANAQASAGRPAGAGPSLVSGYSTTGRGTTSTVTTVAAGAVQITINAGPNGVTGSDINQVRTAVESIFDEHNRRSY